MKVFSRHINSKYHVCVVQVCVITEQACATIRALLEQRPNRASVLRFFIASLQTRCSYGFSVFNNQSWITDWLIRMCMCRAAVSRQRLLSPDGPLCRTTDPSVEMLSSVCDALKHTADELLHLGYRTHAAQATLEHANTLRWTRKHTLLKEFNKYENMFILDAVTTHYCSLVTLGQNIVLICIWQCYKLKLFIKIMSKYRNHPLFFMSECSEIILICYFKQYECILNWKHNRCMIFAFSSRILAAHASSAEEKQRHLLDAFSLMKTAVSLQEEVVSDVLNVLPPHEVRDVWSLLFRSFCQVIYGDFGEKSAEFIPLGNKWHTLPSLERTVLQ